MRMFLVVVSMVVLSGCAAVGKTESDEDFSDLGGLDEKGDAFSYRLKMLGRLGAGESHRTLYSSTPRFRGYDFVGKGGDRVDIWVRSSHGDALSWLLDDKFNVLAKNDDADATTLDSHLEAVLPGAGDALRRFQIVMRDYDLESHYFTTSFAISAPAPGGDWQARAMQTANQMFRAFSSLAPHRIDVAMLPAAGQARVAASAAGWQAPTAYKLVLEGRDFYLVHAMESVQSGIAAVDLIDDAGQWFAHGYSLESDSDLLWSLVETDHTLCNCINPSNGMAACTWLDGSVVESSVMICD